MTGFLCLLVGLSCCFRFVPVQSDRERVRLTDDWSDGCVRARKYELVACPLFVFKNILVFDFPIDKNMIVALQTINFNFFGSVEGVIGKQSSFRVLNERMRVAEFRCCRAKRANAMVYKIANFIGRSSTEVSNFNSSKEFTFDYAFYGRSRRADIRSQFSFSGVFHFLGSTVSSIGSTLRGVGGVSGNFGLLSNSSQTMDGDNRSNESYQSQQYRNTQSGPISGNPDVNWGWIPTYCDWGSGNYPYRLLSILGLGSAFTLGSSRFLSVGLIA